MLAWWHQFVAEWIGVSLMSVVGDLTSEASGGWGYGAYWEAGWFQLVVHTLVQDCHYSTVVTPTTHD